MDQTTDQPTLASESENPLEGFVASTPEVAYEETDVFTWSNNLVQYVDEIKFSLYFFNKSFIPYRAKLPNDLNRQLRPLFLDQIVEYVLDGIDKGLIVRGFEEAEKEDNVLQRTKISNVTKLTELLRWIQKEQMNIEEFSETEHDLRRMKGVIVTCYHKDLPTPFYIIKSLPSSQIMKGVTAWYIKEDHIKPFDEMTALKIPGENQLLAVGQDLFVFNESKLKSLFGYDAKAASVAEKKVKEIEENFKLSFADGASLQLLVKDSPNTIRKLQKIDPSLIKQSDLVDHADDMGVNLMVDDNDAIIIIDGKDLTKFVNLLNDDYIESPVTGIKYEILRKRPLRIKEDTDL